MKIKFTILFALLSSVAVAQNTTDFWQDVPTSNLTPSEKSGKELNLRHARHLQLSLAAMRAHLYQAPDENTATAKRKPHYVALPMPDGTMETFVVEISSVMMPELAARYPAIQSFKARSINNKDITARLDVSPYNFHAMIEREGRTIIIDPTVWTNGELYDAYYEDEVTPTATASCGTANADHLKETENPNNLGIQTRDANAAKLDLRTFRIAISTTGEYAQQFGGTIPAVLASINTALNRLNQMYEREVGIRFLLANNNDRLISLDPATDPYTNSDKGLSLVGQQVSVFASTFRIPFTDYELGHVFTANCTDVGGVVSGLACSTGRAAGVTCFPNTNIEITAVRTFAHEVGHQFTASHTFDQCPNNEDQLSPATAYETGCGRTIMSYADNPIAYFHNSSLQQIISYTRSGTASNCASTISVQNTEPEITIPYQNGFYIPIETPFELTGSATDADNDALLYTWEQFDPEAPLFRVVPPMQVPNRVFPALSSLVSGIPIFQEDLPDTTRDLTFRFTVRDNHPQAGASVWKELKFKSTKDAGPFVVKFPNDDTTKLIAGSYANVQWDVANTDKALVNCQIVNIRLSTDGGVTYPILLAQSVANTGSAQVAVPAITTNRARIRVDAADNVFFDISNEDFQIFPATQAGFTVNASPRTILRQCLPAPVQFTINTASILAFNAPVTFTLEGSLPGDAIVAFSKNPVAPGESTTLTITFNRQIESTFDLQIKATAQNGGTQTVPIRFTTISNDFSDLVTLSPLNGQSDIGLTTAFSWKRSAEATAYDFELATSPTFGTTVIASVNSVKDTFYTPNQIQLDENRLYYWRIRPINECGAGAFIEPSVFHTSTIQCNQVASTNVPINISGSGLPAINSTINITTQGVINDLNVPLIRLRYSPVKSIRVSLISPAGTEVTLYDQSCGNTFRFETGFDDEAPGAMVCPPDDKLVVRPSQALSAFKGQNTAGTWTLRTKVVTGGFGDGGSLEAWNLEFCSNLTLQNPFLVKNDTLRVPPGKTNTYTKNELEVGDNDNNASQLKYILLTLPQHGSLTRSGVTLKIGDTFTQQEVTAFLLKYTHNGDNATSDSFSFVVEDGTGGWLSTKRAPIKIDVNATVGVNDILEDNAISVFPNPTRDMLNIQFEKTPKGSLIASLYNVQGQEVLRQGFENAANVLQINTSQLASGMYFLTLRTAEGIATKKVSVQR